MKYNLKTHNLTWILAVICAASFVICAGLIYSDESKADSVNLNALALYDSGSHTYSYTAGTEISISRGYDDDRGYFYYASPSSFTVSAGQTTTVVITEYESESGGAGVGPTGATVTIYFVGVSSTYTVTINVNDGTYGSVSTNSISNVPSGSSITVNGATLTINGVTVTATPSSATSEYVYVFSNWSNASGTITADRTITANFVRQSASPSLPADYSVALSSGQSWSYTPSATPSGATLSISGTAANWLTLSNGTISGTAPTVAQLTTYTLTITATTTNPAQTATQTVTFTVYPIMTASASPGTMYVYTGGPIPNTSSETVTLTHSSFGTGTYTWSMVDNAGSGMTIASDGTLGGTCLLSPTASSVTITVRCTGVVSGFTQTADVSFNLVVVAKLVFTTNPLTDGVIS